MQNVVAACWASWADVLPMIQAGHPVVAALMVQHLEGDMVTKHGSRQSGSDTVGGDGRFRSASVVRSGRWIVRPEQREPEDHEARDGLGRLAARSIQ